MLFTSRQISVRWLAVAGGVIVAIPYAVGVALGVESTATALEVPAYILWWLLLVVALVSRGGGDDPVESVWKKLLRTSLLVSVPAAVVTLVGVFALFLSDPVTSDDLGAAAAVGVFFAGWVLVVAAATWGLVVVAETLVQRARNGR